MLSKSHYKTQQPGIKIKVELNKRKIEKKILLSMNQYLEKRLESKSVIIF